jgi:hypothetical protein
MRTPRPCRSAIAIAFAAALLLAPAVSHAQGTPTPSPQDTKWWAGVGGGFLAGRAACSNCETDPPFGNGSALVFQGGYRAGDRLLVGGELFTTARTGSSGTAIRDTYLLAIVHYRPFAGQGFFLEGGYGLTVVKDTVPFGGADATARTRGMGVMYGAGWMFGLNRRVSLAPVAAQYVTTVGDVRAPAGTAQNVVINGWFVGAVVMFR